MATGVMFPGRSYPTPLPEPSADQLTLIRQLLSSSNGARQKQVLLDTEIDGVRCTLVRRVEPEPGISLSPREQEIARMIAQGHANKTIAQVLEISTWTVGTYLRRIFSKLGVGSRAAMVARLMEIGVLQRESDRGQGQRGGRK